MSIRHTRAGTPVAPRGEGVALQMSRHFFFQRSDLPVASRIVCSLMGKVFGLWVAANSAGGEVVRS